MQVKSKRVRVEEVTSSDDENGQSSNNECIQKNYSNVTVLKSKLLSHLEEIIVGSRTLKLCDLLIKAHDEGLAGENREDNLDFQILRDIQILMKEPIDEMVELILNALYAHLTDEDEFHAYQQKLKVLFIPFPGEDCRKPAEYLNHLIETMKELVCFYTGDDVEDRKDNLKFLRKRIIFRGESSIDKFYDLMFSFGINNIEFSLEEKNKILSLMLQAMPYTGKLINNYNFRSVFTIDRCLRRSALQFIIELFDNLPEKSDSLKDLLGTIEKVIKYIDDLSARVDISGYDSDIVFSDEEFSDEEFSDVEFSDEEFSDESSDEESSDEESSDEEECGVIDDFGNNYEHETLDDSIEAGVIDDDDYYYEQETLDDFIRAGGERVPKEHTWWQTYRKAHFPDQ